MAHDYACRVMQHSCGSVLAILSDYVEDGVDVLDPVQIGAAGMGLDGLLSDFGTRLCFHGGADMQHTLALNQWLRDSSTSLSGTPAEVRAMVRAHRELTRARGGYIMTSSQDLVADIPDDGTLAMHEENAAG
ncbi:MAG: hypothetical protein AB1505_09880 [Candidatus Latescibacterota bacterium]